MRKSEFVSDGNSKTKSRLIKAMEGWKKPLESYEIEPEGVFGSIAVVKCGGITISSELLDLEFVVPFDDDLEANEAEIIVYNLSNHTINQLKYRSSISIEAGYGDDTGVVFNGFIDRVYTKQEGTDKITTIKCFDDVAVKTIESISYIAGTSASYILKNLIDKTGIPVAVFKPRRDWTYKDAVTVDGDLMANIKKYAEVCGISVYVNKGKIYARHIKDGDNINFMLSCDTGMIGSPTEFEEEVTAEDFKETVKGYEVVMLLQHRMTTAAQVNINSRSANGAFRVRSGEHRFSQDESVTKIKVI